MQWQQCDDPKEGHGCGQFHTPPKCQGQIILVSYASGEDGVIFQRVWDQNDGTRTYRKRLLGPDEEFEPWNVEPA